MNIPLSWLKTYVDIPPEKSIRQFMEDITLVGITAESHIQLGEEISGVVVGRMESIEKHPNADKLLITQVDVGTEKLQIVTGATNLKVGDYVPVAVHGAKLSGGLAIKKGKLRGEVSNGMLCSIEELGYTRQDYPESPEDGIYVFQEPQPLGADVRPIMELTDNVIEFELTSNRSDCQSVIGIAREVAATYKQRLTIAPVTLKEEGQGQATDYIDSVTIENPNLCSRYVARVVKNVTIADSPQWLRHRLTAAGLRPVNNIVDITNYVMLEYGQPLHAFDIDHIAQKSIIVRNAKKDETFITLDGTTRVLDESMLVIADPERAVALAGIMGGENSKVSGNATAVLFESANFDGTNVRLTCKKLGMRTDASARFEKGLDPNLPIKAINRAMQLVEELGCGEVVPGVVDNYAVPRESWTVTYDPSNINRLLGTDISVTEMVEILGQLEIESKDGKAIIPTFRADISCEADITEEVARFYGYSKIPVNPIQRNILGGSKTLHQKAEDTIKYIMTALGYSEAMTCTIESPKIFDKLNIPQHSELRNSVTISNPLGEDFSIMRTTSLNGILQSLALNFNRRNESARLFELAKVYRPRQVPMTELPDEPVQLIFGAYAHGRGLSMDFFDMKGDVEQLLSSLRIQDFRIEPWPNNVNAPETHPGRTAALMFYDGEQGYYGGYVGEIHPDVTANYEIGTRVYIAVIELGYLLNFVEKNSKKTPFSPLPKYPAMARDIALQVKQEISAADIEKAIREKAGALLSGLTLFDVYQGKQVEEGYKSMAYSLSFRAADRTLTDSEITAQMQDILAHLQSTLQIALRDK